ncbi:hypothetical protein Cabys_537 [Caldithrix abyssi DSM 13497]|uniref:Uncharacterized protein n=1 Tax=Caldithrix abyssi DSM 13497 TaxID=880073 RepID=A0A1J1C5X2_CALAY|nr:hypothetical protein Cabys_537 [Caldithrix abyssi DSM 13497]
MGKKSYSFIFASVFLKYKNLFNNKNIVKKLVIFFLPAFSE